MAKRQNIEDIKEIAVEYVALLQKHGIKVVAAYLFGSYVKKTHHQYSDIDLAIVLPQKAVDPVDDRVRLMKYTWDIDTRIEPHPFAKVEFTRSNPFAYEIITTGTKLT
ncbi:MAG: nucleotidyltransferase domain-containing protein [Elusimicrobiota bacterium]